MPVSPSYFEWWQWLLCGAVAAVIAVIMGVIASMYFDSNKPGSTAGGCLFTILAIIPGLSALACFGVGIIRFVKWVWAG